LVLEFGFSSAKDRDYLLFSLVEAIGDAVNLNDPLIPNSKIIKRLAV